MEILGDVCAGAGVLVRVLLVVAEVGAARNAVEVGAQRGIAKRSIGVRGHRYVE